MFKDVHDPAKARRVRDHVDYSGRFKTAKQGTQGSRATWRRMGALGIACILVLTLWPQQALADLDPPGPPTLGVAVDLNTVRLTSNQNDGFDGNSELLLVLNVTHWKGQGPQRHGSTTQPFSVDDYNWNTSTYEPSAIPGAPMRLVRTTAPDWWIKQQVWQHYECTPRSQVTVGTTLIEVDVDGITTGTGIVASSLGGLAAGMAVGALTGSPGGPPGAIAGAVVGAVISVIAALDGNDDLGATSGIVPASDDLTLDSKGDDGGATIDLTGTTTEYDDSRCAPDAPQEQQAYVSPSDRAAAVFPGLQEAYAMGADLKPEDGNPAGLSDARTQGIRDAWHSVVLGTGETAAALAVLSAANAPGVDAAMESYLAGRELGSTDPQAALEMYQDAFVQALTSLDEAPAGSAGPGLGSFPLSLALTTDRISTQPSRQFSLGALALGASGDVGVQVVGLPDGVEAQVQRVNDSMPAYSIHVALGDVAPGTYPVQLVASDGSDETVRNVELVVNPAPEAAPTQPLPGDIEVTTTAEGTRLASVQVPSTIALKTLVEQLASTGQASETSDSVTLDLSQVVDELDLTIEGPALSDLAADKRALILRTALGGIVLDPAALDVPAWAESVSATVSDLEVVLHLQRANVAERALIDDAVERLGGQRLWDQGGLKVSLTAINRGTGVSSAIESFGTQFVQLELTLPLVVDPETSTAAVMTPTGLRAVPAAMDGRNVMVQRNGPGLYTVVSRDVSFSDTQDHWAKSIIDLLAHRLILSGTGAGRFEPDRSVTRAEATAMIARGLGLLPEPAQSFSDVPEGAWFQGEVGAAVGFGLVTGYADGSFGPANPISRAEAATILVRAMQTVSGGELPGNSADLGAFADCDSFPSWAEDYLAKAVHANLMGGYADGSLQPNRVITRAELAALLYRALGSLGLIDVGTQ